MAGIKGRTVGGLVLLPLLVMAGCGRSVPGPYTPEVAGIVVAAEPAGNSLGRFVLDNGQSFTVNIMDAKATTFVYRRGGGVGDLLLGGNRPGPWVAFLSLTTRSDLPADCYDIVGYATDEGDWIQTDDGLRLRKAPGFDPGLLPDVPGDYVPTAHPGLRYDAPVQTFCVNRDGRVTLRDW